MTGDRGFAGRIRSLVKRANGAAPGAPGRDGRDEELEEARRKVAEKNGRLEKLRGRLGEKDREIEKLRADVAEARRDLPPPELSGEGAPVFFVVGRGKSGTTWLQKTLDSHPEVLCRGEGRFFERDFLRMVPVENLRDERFGTVQPTSLYAALASSEDLVTWIERSVWTEGEDLHRHLGNLNRLAAHYFLADRLSRTGKKIVGDKTTFSNGRVLEEIGAVFPEAKVAHMIRDGRDHAVSMIHHMWNNARDTGGFYDLESEELAKRDRYRDGGLPPGESLFTEKRLRVIARAWGTQVGRATEYGPAKFGDHYLEVRYEDLLVRPGEELGKVLVLLGADATEETVRRCLEANTFSKYSEGRESGQEESSSFFRKGVAGDWKNVFTEEDKETFKRAVGDTLVKLGYEKDDGW